ncbi:MAG: discoidin domain-containing protein [Fibrobacterales bacterium]
MKLFSKNIKPIVLGALLCVTTLSAQSYTLVSQNATATASSIESPYQLANHAVDGDMDTRWSSEHSNFHWLQIDLGSEQTIEKLELHWENAFAESYKIYVSQTSSDWGTAVHERNSGDGGFDEIIKSMGSGRYITIECLNRATIYGFSLYEVLAYTKRGQLISWLGELNEYPLNPESGEAFFHATEHKSFTYKNGSWGYFAIGETGATGQQGVQGVQGDQGVQGGAGPQGLQGVQGAQGEQGLQGESGVIETGAVQFNHLSGDAIDNLSDLYGQTHAAWREDNSGFNLIAYWNGKEKKYISDPSHHSSMPHISKNKVVWATSINSAYKVFYWDGSIARQITLGSGTYYSPKISGDNIVWMSSYNIHAWNGSEIIQISDPASTSSTSIETSESGVVWKSTVSGISKIFYWDGTTTQQLSSDTEDSYAAKISGNNVVWITDGKVYLWNGTTGVTTQLSNSEIISSDPDIYEERVVWSGTDGQSRSQIFLWDGVTTQVISDISISSTKPQLTEKGIVWLNGSRHDGRTAHYWNGTTTQSLTTVPSRSIAPYVSGNKIIWNFYNQNNNKVIWYWNGSSISQITDDNISAYEPVVSTASMAGGKGSDGEQGIQGEAGNPGIQGEAGIQGVAGTPGIQGEAGIQGVAGTPGVQGEQGIKGETGIPGEQGEKGDTGDTGNAMQWLGMLNEKPTAPTTNQAFYWDGVGISCIYDGASWGILSRDGGVTATICERAIECQVSSWSNWSTCSETACNVTGSQSRTRTIEVNPENGGETCPALQETQTCSRLCA